MALQDLTPQLRTRLNRTEKAAGWFVLIAVVLLVVGLSYYLYQTAKNRGWFIPQGSRYETGVNDASGLKVGDPVQLMGRDAGQITAIVPNEPNAYFGMTVFFEILKPNYGYIWADSVVKVQASLLGARYLEVTKGKVGLPTVIETNNEVAGLFVHKYFRQRQKALLAAGTNTDDIWNIVKAEAAAEPTNFYQPPSEKPIWISPDEAPSLNDRADKLVSEVEAALPNILALTNSLNRVLANSGDLTSNLNVMSVDLRPAISNLASLSGELHGPGALGTWALGDTNMAKVGTTLDTANLTLAHTDTNLTATLESLALITSNLNAQVQANSNMLGSISKIVVDTDDLVQGLKRHWLLRSAFQEGEQGQDEVGCDCTTNAPPAISPSATPAVLVIFALTYLGIALGRVPYLKINRIGIALLGAIAIMVFSGLPTTAVVSFVNWPTILLLFGFFVLSAQLRLSGFFDLVAAGISARLGHPARFLLILMLASAGLSAFLNNDIVCFVFAPVVGAALLRQQINPVPFLIALAVASNIGASATVVGNAQDMMIAETAGLDFGRYLLWCIIPVLFALGCAYGLIWMMSRHNLVSIAPAPAGSQPPLHPYNRAHTIKGLVILALVIAFFFSSVPKEIIALTAAGIHLASPKFRTHDLLALVDWPILVLFMGLFVVTGVFQATGCGEQAVQWLAHAGVNLQSLPVLAVVTALLSNLISNAAAVMLLVKVTNIAHPATAYVLALANSLGGNLIIIGSLANIIVVLQARDLGINIGFRDFARLGVPVTLASLAGLLAWVMVMG